MLSSKKKIKVSFLKIIFLFIFFNFSNSFANQIDKIVIEGNDRISNDTIKIFSEIKTDEIINDNKLNLILKNLYETNFFSNVKVSFIDNILFINVTEAPIINSIEFEGIKAEKIKDSLNKIIKLRSRSSYNDFLASNDRELILTFLKSIGYYFANVETVVESLENNLVKVTHDVDLGEKAKIKKISFLGDKVFKDNKLRNLIISEEYKFWKIISGKKYLNEQTIEFDKKLLKNFYLNEGYYNVEVNSSFARLVDNQEFELIYNINAKEKIYFDNLTLNLPNDFNLDNFSNLKILFNEIKGKPYSINTVDKILDEIDSITLNEEYKSILANVDESLSENKLSLNFNIEETEKLFVEKINIFGNNITRESVIRNYLEIDEGDPYNEILQSKV